MKSLKIAALGVAAFGLAALPVAGVFAANGDGIMKHKDELTVNILPVCTLGTLDEGGKVKQYTPGDGKNATSETAAVAADDNTSHTAANGSWVEGNVSGNGTSGIEGYRTDIYSVTMQPGTENASIATTTFTIRCNNTNGYTLSATPDANLVNPTGSETGKNIPFAANGTGTTTSWWKMTVSADASLTPTSPSTATATTIATKGSVGNIDAGENVTVTYGVGLNKNQESGSYTGSVIYTLAQIQ